MLRNKSNRDLFTLYDSDLILRVRNTRNLENERQLLARFAEYLNDYPPSPELRYESIQNWQGIGLLEHSLTKPRKAGCSQYRDVQPLFYSLNETSKCCAQLIRGQNRR